MKFMCFALVILTLTLCFSAESALLPLKDIVLGEACYMQGASCAMIPSACCPNLTCVKSATTQEWTCEK